MDGHHIIQITKGEFPQQPLRAAEPIDVTLVPHPGKGPKEDGDIIMGLQPARPPGARQPENLLYSPPCAVLLWCCHAFRCGLPRALGLIGHGCQGASTSW
jgi:hypothetical protein